MGRGEQCSSAFVRLQGLYNFKLNRSPKRDVEGAVPYIMFTSSTAAKSPRSLRILPSAENNKSGADFVLRYLLCLRRKFVVLLFPSAPLSRLAPIEALPQAPLGALPPDPHNGFHPLTLTRGVPLDLLLASLGVCYHTLYSFVIPHSSLLT